MRYSFNIPMFLEWVVESWAPVSAMADRAAYSRSHFSRLFSRELGETPDALRRRLRLEAGAHLLLRTDWSVGEVAVEVGYQTPEAFTKAFARSFGLAPRLFRGSRLLPFLGSVNGMHFHPSGLIVRRQGDKTMTLTKILFEHHVDEVRALLGAMEPLTDGQLDSQTTMQGEEIPFDPHKGTLRTLLDRVIFTQEVWLAAFQGAQLPACEERTSVAGMLERHKRSGNALLQFVAEIEEQGLWDSEFVDALCAPPERFSYGGVLAHILVFSAHRRQMALAALRNLGTEIGYGDPINWLRARSLAG